MTGRLPTELGQLTAYGTAAYGTAYDSYLYKVFDLKNNEFRGTIPTELGAMSGNKGGITLANNELTGRVPTQLGRMTKMTYYVSLVYNELCDAVPTQVQALSLQIQDWHIEDGNDIGEVGRSWSATRH